MDINTILHRKDIPNDVQEFILTIAAEWEQLKEEHKQVLESAPVCLTVVDKETIRAFENAVEGIVRCDTQGKILHTNDTFTNMLGYSENEANGQDWKKFIGKEDQKHLQKVYQQMLSEGKVTTETHGVRKDGSIFYIKMTLFSTFDKNDEFAGHYCFIQDITQHTKAIKILETSKERFNLALDAGHTGIWDWLVNDDILIWNKHMYELFGVSNEEFDGHYSSFTKCLHPGDRERVEEEIKSTVKNKSLCKTTFRVIHEDKSIHYIYLKVKTYCNNQNEFTRVIGTCQDITWRVQAELDLKASEEHNRSILESAGEGIYGLDIEGNLTFANKAAEKMLGYQAHELIGKPMHALIHHSYPDGSPYPLDKCPVCAAFTDGSTNTIVNEVLWHKDGTAFPVEYTATPLKKGDSIIGAVVTFNDITIRKSAEEQLAKNALEINLIYQCTKITSESSSIEEAIQNCIDLICDSLEWPVGHAYVPNENHKNTLIPTAIWHIDDLSKVSQFREITEQTEFKSGVGLPGRILSSKKPEWIEDVHKDENFPRAKSCENLNVYAAVGFPVIVNKEIIAVLEFFAYEPKKNDHNLLRVFQILSEQVGRILERRLATEALKQAEEKNRLILNSAGEGIYGLDTNGITTFINPAAERMLGYSANELIGQPMHQLIHHSHPDGTNYPLEKCPMYAALTDGTVHRVNDEVLWCKDGTSFSVEYTSTPIFKGNEVIGAVVTFRDITARKQAEQKLLLQTKALENKAEELAEINTRLQKSNQELDQFAYIISHDLKAPLRGINNLATWIKEDSSNQLDEQMSHHLHLIRKRAKSMNSLIEGILNYSRIGRTDTEVETVDVKTLLDEVIEQIDHPSTFNIEIKSNMPILKAPPIPLSQVFSNLIGNGIKYHHSENGHIIISAKEEKDYYQFSIADDGPGIAPEYHEKIFTIFQTLHNKNKDVESTGIGLTIVKKIIEWQGGSIKLESNIDKGATFHFTWPKQPRMDA